jgi:hypothetical protein
MIRRRLRHAGHLAFVALALAVASLGWSFQSADAKTRLAYLVTGLSDEEALVVSSNFAAAEAPGVLLFDSPALTPYLKAFLTTYRAEQIVALGAGDKADEVHRRLGLRVTTTLAWDAPKGAGLWKRWFPKASRVVVCPSADKRLLLQAACLAGALKAPLYPLRDDETEKKTLPARLADWGAEEVYAVGPVPAFVSGLPGIKLVPLTDEAAVVNRYLDLHAKTGALDTLVVANPADGESGKKSLSRLAPWIAVKRRALLLLTNDKGDDAGAIIREVLKKDPGRAVEHVILVGDLEALPRQQVPSPIFGKDKFIDVEPPAPGRDEPVSLATGRLFHRDPAVVALLLAREQLLRQPRQDYKALVISNPGGGLPLLETLSRNTARELLNAGYQVKGQFGSHADPDELRAQLADADLFLWEGHYATLVDRYGMPSWKEPLKPSLVFLQSCLALSEDVAQPFLERGAVAVVGSPARTYSASGGAFTLAFFDSAVYDKRTLGGALRHAKNFLLAFARLKNERLGDSELTGSCLRSAWGFTLWGDPTLRLPVPKPPPTALQPVTHQVRGKRIEMLVPEVAYDDVGADPYVGKMWPNARLAGLLRPDQDGQRRRLVPLLFAELALPQVPSGKAPSLSSSLPSERWTFLWDARRKTGYLLVLPRTKTRPKLTFDLDWN